ncbi:hypothetical protein AVEN_244324-1 [Araneus ventricosus]|uniref:Uncharacterized protein n=1 Tax=Araneus ventricosus TaxID=182803 RepID=A0A4Y2S8U3_ARAVE|nr:hypothetical protein AVEN_244324-1 [Araneus ventricosus]
MSRVAMPVSKHVEKTSPCLTINNHCNDTFDEINTTEDEELTMRETIIAPQKMRTLTMNRNDHRPDLRLQAPSSNKP